MKNEENSSSLLLQKEPLVIDSGLEDHDAVRNVLGGAINEYRKLVEKYQVIVFNLFLGMLQNRDEAEEMTQDVFVKVYEALPSFRFEYRFYSWLYRICINHALSHLKSRKKYVGVENIGFHELENEADVSESKAHIKMAVNRLKDKYKVVIILKYYQQLSYTEMSFALNITEKKVRSRLYDGRIMLKDILEKTEFY